MPRTTFLAATALVLCASLSFAGQRIGQTGVGSSLPYRRPGLPARFDHPLSAVVAIGRAGALPVRNNVSHWVPGAVFNNFSKDKNAEFMSWYGFFAFGEHSCYTGDASSTCVSAVAINAIAITGTGKKVKSISVPLTTPTSSKTEFNVGIFSATSSGLPGSHELAGGSTTASNTGICCTAVRAVKVDVTLKAGQKYFVEVTCPTSEKYCAGVWDMADTNFSGDTQDYYRFRTHVSHFFQGKTTTFSVSSPWHLSTQYPDQPAAIVK